MVDTDNQTSQIIMAVGGNRGKSDLGINSNSDDDSIEDELLQNFEDQISKVHLTF